MIDRFEQRAICEQECPAQCFLAENAKRAEDSTQNWTDFAARQQAWEREAQEQQLPIIDELTDQREFSDTDTVFGAESASKLGGEIEARGSWLAALGDSADFFAGSDERQRERNANVQALYAGISENAYNTCSGTETARVWWPPRDFGKMVTKCTGAGVPENIRQGEWPQSIFSND